MSSIGKSEVYDSINMHLGDVFGNDFEMAKCNGQISVLVEPSSNINNVKFSQVMNHLSSKREWFYRKQCAGETLYEDALERLGVPLEIKYRQKTVFVPRPPSEAPLEKFLPCPQEELERTYDLHRKLQKCYSIIDKSLKCRKAQNYPRKEKEIRGQKKITGFQKGQALLENFYSEYETKKKPRVGRWRKIRFDMVFRVPEIPTMLFAEIKPFTTVAKSIVNARARQLMSYDAWLETKNDSHLTPLLYISPTIISHREFEMIESVKRESERDVIPLCITTPSYLKNDLNKRFFKAKRVIEVAKELDMNPEVVEGYRKERSHVLGIVTNYSRLF